MPLQAAELAATRRRSVLEAAKEAGFLDGPNSALGARVPRSLVEMAKVKAGVTSTTELVEYALAKVALEDDFGAKLVARKGSVPADIDLDF